MVCRNTIAALLLAGLSPFAQAQSFPARTITIVHPFGPGSGTDQDMRLIADEFTRLTNVAIVLDARPGGNGMIALQAVARGNPDGYTLLRTTSSTQIINPILYKDLPVNPLSDFVPVIGLTKAYQVMVVDAASPFATVADFIAAARKKEMSFGSGTAAMRMGGELFKQLARINMLHVPYKSTPAAMTDLLGGRVDTLFADLAVARPLIQAGKLKPLAVTSLRRLESLPAVPTLDESGLKGFENAFWAAIFAPKATPEPVVRRLNELFARANQGAGVEKHRSNASMVTLNMPGAELAKYQEAELARWKQVAAGAGITPE